MRRACISTATSSTTPVVADEAERAIIRDHVRRIVDHMIEGGYTFCDIDGKTNAVGRLGAGETEWRPGLARETLVETALEILGYLRLAEMTDRRPEVPNRATASNCLKQNHYDRYASHPLATEPSERTQFDEELAGVALHLAAHRTAFPSNGAFTKMDSPSGGSTCVRKRGRCSISSGPRKRNHGSEASLLWTQCVEQFTRRTTRLGANGPSTARKRETCGWSMNLCSTMFELDRILPPSERATSRSDSNLYSAVRGEDGMSESSGVVWLLPYWMGRYYGFIDRPK